MKSFRIVDTRFRILKGGKVSLAASIALIGGMLSFGSVSAHADTITTLGSGGSATPGLQDMGISGYDAIAGHNWSTVDFKIQTPSIDALGIRTTANDTNGDLNYDTFTYNTTYDNTITLYSGKNITGQTATYGELLGIYTEDHVSYNGRDTTYNNTGFNGTGTLNVQGNNVINGMVGVNYNHIGGEDSVNIDKIGTINLNGYNVTFGDQVNAVNTNINSGTNNTINNDYTFYGNLNSHLNFNQAASVLLNGGLTGNLNYNGYNSIVTIGQNQTIDGSVTTSGVNGVLVFQGAGNVNGAVGDSADSLKEVRANGVGEVLFNSTSTAYVDHVNYQAAATIGFNGGLDLTVDNSTDAVNTVTFNNHDGVLQINNGNLIGIEGQAVVTTTSNNKGTVTMVGGTQSIVGNIGSTGHAIKTLNIGDDNLATGLNNGSGYSDTTVHGDVHAQLVKLNNNYGEDSTLQMASGYNIDAVNGVQTNLNGYGNLSLLGGTQYVTGPVGANGASLFNVDSGANDANSTFQSDVYAVNVTNDGNGTTNFNTNVSATNINVNNGTSNFTNNVTATTTYIGTGTGNFNTNGTGVTTSDIAFSDVGTANLHTGLTGNIDFGGNNATVNVWDANAISGAITTTTNNTGILNYRGDGDITSTVGAANMGIASLNINTNNDQNTTSGVTAHGNIFAGVVNLEHNGTLTRANDVNVTSTDMANQAIATDSNNTGTLTLLGSSTISGQVGTDAKRLAQVNSGVDSTNSTFMNDVYATTLRNTGTGTTNLDGNFKGTTLNFGEDGLVNLANNKSITANVTTDANNSGTLTFVQNGTMNGQIGTADASLKLVNISAVAGSQGTVTTDTIYAINTAINNGSTLNIRADKNINGMVTTETNATGILNLVGGTQYVTGQVGADTMRLAEVNSGANDANSTFQSDVFAVNVTNTGMGTTNFDTNVSATNINVNNGTSNFTNNVTATTISIDNGIGNFNTNGTGVTTGNIVFNNSSDQTNHGLDSTTAIANLHNGLTGNINFNGEDATVNLSAGKTITGNVYSNYNDYGYVNFRGNGAVTGSTYTYGINIGTDANATVTFGGNVIAGNEIWLHNDSTMVLDANKSVGIDSGDGAGYNQWTNIGTMTAHTGTLTLLGGTQEVHGHVGVRYDSNVGEDGVYSLKRVNAGVNGSTTTFDGMVFADKLLYTGTQNATVVLNGTNPSVYNYNNSDAEGMVGTVDFGSYENNTTTKTLEIGNNVNLTTGTDGIQFANANQATLVFNGNSTVTGVLGGGALGANTTDGYSTFKAIYAGNAVNDTVTFRDDVYVMEQAGGIATFYAGAGTVNFQGNLYGDLVMDANRLPQARG